MRILSLSSQVAFGPVGNSAAVPALQAKGHEVLAVPTVMLSNHPGHGRPVGFRTTPSDLKDILAALAGLGVLEGCHAVMAGYFASPEQIDAFESILVRMKQTSPGLYVLIDPVMGDGNDLYVPHAVAEAIRAKLIPLATCITPNRFELEWLSGIRVGDEESAAAAARHLGVAEVLATSIPSPDDQLATLLMLGDARHRTSANKLDQVPHGTGDFLSGLYLAARLNHSPEHSFRSAMVTLTRAIAMSAGTAVLDIAGALHGGVSPVRPAGFVGIDGCPHGWCVVQWDGAPDGTPTVSIVDDIGQLDVSGVIQAGIDIPIGFPDTISQGGRPADRTAREFIGPKGSSVFPAPCRAALGARSQAEAGDINARHSIGAPIRINAVTYAILAKMKQVDDFMSPAIQEKVVEIHPEVSFAAMNGGTPVMSSKNTPAGQDERRRLLRQGGFPVDALSPPSDRRSRWAWDDLLDACACAWSAKRVNEGTAMRFPAQPPRDAKGLRMEINA